MQCDSNIKSMHSRVNVYLSPYKTFMEICLTETSEIS